MTYSSQRFERDIVTCFNTFFREHHIKGIAYRQQKTQFSAQFCDVMVDSVTHPQFFMGIECKTLDTTSSQALYFSGFSKAGGVHQLDRMKAFLEQSGRHGYLAVELRKPHKLTAYLIPFNYVYYAYGRKNSMTLYDIRQYGFRFTRKGSAYSIEEMCEDPYCQLTTLPEQIIRHVGRTAIKY